LEADIIWKFARANVNDLDTARLDWPRRTAGGYPDETGAA
jgi:hypothetical protein